MDFSGEVAEWQRNVSEGKAGNSRRNAVVGALEVHGGKSYLDVGCGGGHLVRELGNAVGTEGRVVGIDSSPQILETARTICQGIACVDIIEGTATAIPSDDVQFDGLAAPQVYEM